MEKVLIAGATGTTGQHIVNQLKKTNQFEPIAMVRKKEQAEDFNQKGIETVIADLEKDLSKAVQNIDRIIFAAGSKGKKLIEVDQEGAKKLIDSAVMANVSKFVMLSSVGADNPEKGNQNIKPYLEAKHNADEYLKNAGINYTIVRPTTLNNNDGNGSIQLEKKFKNPTEISREDVATTLISVIPNGIADRKTFEITEGEQNIATAVKNV